MSSLKIEEWRKGISGVKRRVEDRRSVRVGCSVILLRKNCLHTSRCRNRTACLVIFLKAFLKNCVLEEVFRLFWSLSKHFWKDQAHRFLHAAEFCTLRPIIRLISGKVFSDAMDINSLVQSAQDNPPDDISLTSKLDLDNQTIIIIIILFLSCKIF